MQELGEIITKVLRKYRVQVIPITSSSCMVAENKRLMKIETEPFRLFLKLGLVPMCSGDVVADRELGHTIISGDQIAVYLAKELKASKVIFGSDVDGIFTSDPKQNKSAELISIIKSSEIGEILNKFVSETTAQDVTGGMLGKLSEINELVNLVIETIIMNLNRPEDLTRIIKDRDVRCTRLIPEIK